MVAPALAPGRASRFGAALALRDTGRLPVAVVGDGDFLMGVTALWTAVHYHTFRCWSSSPTTGRSSTTRCTRNGVARMRGRPVENRWIGQRLADPEIDLASARPRPRHRGCRPGCQRRRTVGSFARGRVASVAAGGVAVVDVRVEPGYAPAMARAMTRDANS